jgi:putative peptidoglycan lipid II flippase
MPLARKLATIGAATLLSRVLGFVREIGIAAVLGAGAMADAFFAALLVPNLFRRLLADGAFGAAYMPLELRLRRDSAEAATFFAAATLGTLLVLLGAIVLVLLLLAPTVIAVIAPGFTRDPERFSAAVVLLRLAAGYVAFAGLVALAAARLNAAGRVGAAAIGPISFNLVMLLAIAGAAAATTPSATATLLASAVVLAGAVQLGVVGGGVLRLDRAAVRPRLAWTPELARLYRRLLPGALATSTPQLALIAGAMIASSSPQAVSFLHYAFRLYELPLGLVAAAAGAVMLPMIAATAHARPAAVAAQSRALELGLGLALPAAVGLALLAEPVVAVLFERGAFGRADTLAVAAALAVLAAGLPGHVLEKGLATACFAREEARSPMLAALGGLAAAVAVALLLFPRHGHVGIAAGLAVAGWVGSAIIAAVMARRGWGTLDAPARRNLPRIVVSAAAMGAMVAAGRAALVSGPAADVGAAVLLALLALGLVSYAALLVLLGVLSPRALRAAMRLRV